MFGIASENGFVNILPGIKIKTLCYGQSMLMTEFRLLAGTELPKHEHPFEQTGYLVKGNITLVIGESHRNILPGDSWSIPEGVSHSAKVLEDSVALEVFNPARDDYKQYLNINDVKELGA